jgi:hypothetical protein
MSAASVHRALSVPAMAISSSPGSVTAARAVAAEVLADLRRGMLLDPAFDRRTADLDARDRRWTQELVWGMLRRRAWLDALLASGSAEGSCGSTTT